LWPQTAAFLEKGDAAMNEISLDTTRLENVKHLDGGAIRAACPACRAAGSDKSGEHLLIQPGGKFGCATHKDDGEHRKEIFKVAGNRTSPTSATNGAHRPTKSKADFNWRKCVADFSEADAQKLAASRGLSIEFVCWLHTQGIVGIFEGKIAFANHGSGGKVVSAHVRLANGKWIFDPKGQQTSPLVFGDTKAAGYVMAFESQWDAFAVMDKFGWHTGSGLTDTAIFITRGAGNGKLILGQIASNAVCYAFKQNDAPTPEKPTTAGDVWLAEVASNAGCRVLNVATPAPHKDANDWTRAGASSADLQAAMKAAKPVQSAPAPDSNRADIASEYLSGNVEQPADDLPDLIDAADFLAEPIDPPAELIEGILHKGSKLAFGGSSKSFKTWSLLDVAISVATGADWLGHTTAQGKVLFLNFEIQPHAWQRRIVAVAKAGGRKPEHSPADLLALLPAGGLENKAWQKVADENGISRRTFFRLRKALETAGKIHPSTVNGTWQPILKK